MIAKTAEWQPVNSKTGAYPMQTVALSNSTATTPAAAITAAASNGAADSTEVSKNMQ